MVYIPTSYFSILRHSYKSVELLEVRKDGKEGLPEVG